MSEVNYLLITMNGGCGAIQKASYKTKPLYPNHSFKTVQFLKNYRCSSIFILRYELQYYFFAG